MVDTVEEKTDQAKRIMDIVSRDPTEVPKIELE